MLAGSEVSVAYAEELWHTQCLLLLLLLVVQEPYVFLIGNIINFLGGRKGLAFVGPLVLGSSGLIKAVLVHASARLSRFF